VLHTAHTTKQAQYKEKEELYVFKVDIDDDCLCQQCCVICQLSSMLILIDTVVVLII
jgi:hypothetical protein